MRTVLLLAIILPACASSPDHTISGRYVTQRFDSPPVYVDGQLTGASVVEVTASDASGLILDMGTFHDPTQAGSWSVVVPDGADGVHLVFLERTSDNMDRGATYLVLDPVTDDLDVGTVLLP
jgi:hypothetical protein